jgi:hypothetical protein
MVAGDITRNEKISANGQYTFRFSSDGVFKKDASGLRGDILQSGLPVKNVNVSYEGGLAGFFGSIAVVSFTWMDAGWTVEQVQSNLAGVMSKGAGNYSFVSAKGGTEIEDTSNLSVFLQPSSIVVTLLLLLLAYGFIMGFGRGVGEKL